MFRSVQIHSTASISPAAKKDTRSERVPNIRILRISTKGGNLLSDGFYLKA